MAMRKIMFLACLFILMAVPSSMLIGGDLKIEAGQHFVLLATTKTGTMQKEMNEAADSGFRVRMGAPTSDSEIVILMERLATPPDLYKYELLATKRTGTMDKELNEAGDRGFRLLPQTMIAKKERISLGIGGNVEIVTVLEKAPKSSVRYQYKLLATSRTSTMEKEIREAEAAGFILVSICSRGEHMVIMEKELK
jgi:hypothetical protein